MTDAQLVEQIQNRAKESRASVTPYSFGELAGMYKARELKISPDYQRLFRWSDEKQSQFLETLLLEMPVPPLFMIQLEDETYELADGLQRLSTYLRFTGAFEDEPPEDAELLERVKEPLELQSCDIVKELNGYRYQTLPTALAIRLRRSRIDCAIVKLGSDPNLRYYIFKRLNSGGEKLSEHESRSSFTRMLNAQAVDFVVGLSKRASFKDAISTITENQSERRFDQELVLRFFALMHDASSFKHDIDPFLTEFFAKLARNQFSFEQLESEFAQTFDTLDSALQDDSFTLAGKKQFSVLHYEGISIATARLLRSGNLDVQNLKENVGHLKQDAMFINVAKGGGKNSAGQFRDRVEIAERFLRI